MPNLQLSQSTIEKLGYYVYLLIDPRDDQIFYVGKGKGNRINQHLLGALGDSFAENDKIKKIKEIQSLGLKVQLSILRHELTEKEALEVESSAIDLLKISNLTNQIKGHNADDRGLMKLEDIKIKYEAEPAIIEEPSILININNLYNSEMTESEIYEATRKSWRIDVNRAESIKLAFSVYRGIIREVFMVKAWRPSPEVPGRYMFDGHIAAQEVRQKYLHKSVAQYWQQGSQNPIKYVLPQLA
jgi:hypothetical protein